MERIGEKLLVCGSTDAESILLMPMDLREMQDAPLYEQMLSDQAQVPFSLLLYWIDDWNTELSPWPAPPVYGKEPFSGRAEHTLETIRKEADSFFQNRTILIGGYSLAGFFALWAAYQTDLFTGVAAVSPSLWYPGWIPYAEANPIRAKAVYLSLGDREEKTKHPVLSVVGDGVRRQEELLKKSGVLTTLEWNPGGHFQDPVQRTVKGFLWLLSTLSEK